MSDPNASLEQRVTDLENKLDDQIRNHYHDGLMATRLDVSDIIGQFQVVAVAPTHTPRDIYDQIIIYVNGATLRLYWYDWVNHAWHYVTATA